MNKEEADEVIEKFLNGEGLNSREYKILMAEVIKGARKGLGIEEDEE